MTVPNDVPNGNMNGPDPGQHLHHHNDPPLDRLGTPELWDSLLVVLEPEHDERASFHARRLRAKSS